MLDPRAEYLRRLDAALAHDTEPAVAAALHQEIAAHLDATIQARMEMGDAAEEAVRQAIAALGAPQSIAAGVAAVHHPEADAHEDRFLRAALGAAALVPLFLLVIPYVRGPWIDATQFFRLYFVLALCLLTLVGIYSFLCRRISPYRLMKVGLAGGLGVWLVLSLAWVDLRREGGAGMLPRWQVAPLLSRTTAELDENRLHQSTQAGIIRTQRARGEDAAWVRHQLENLKGYAATLETERQALLMARDRTTAERLLATSGGAASITVQIWLVLTAVNAVGALLGRRWNRRRYAREQAHV